MGRSPTRTGRGRYWSGVEAPDVAPLSWLPRAWRLPRSRRIPGGIRAARPAVSAYVTGTGLHRRVTTSETCTRPRTLRALRMSKPSTSQSAAQPTRPASSGLWLGNPPGSRRSRASRRADPIVFVALGSSGPALLLPRVLEALAALPVRIIAATGRDPRVAELPENCILAAEFIPYAEACAAASLVICNGGAPCDLRRSREGAPRARAREQSRSDAEPSASGAPRRHGGGRPVTPRLRRIHRTVHPERAVAELARGASRAIAAYDDDSLVTEWLARLR